ncbi:iron complex outermembrane receptor protein [Duganella sp. HSC-15S17]|uniref:Iron complex outermembrane receptor protein n=2 Tax=Duganella violaceipulchra TaxID=2849652 RepID=A0ABT1GP12_9BURK|nr:iron complex outermembrane receptor protein [Duganella violaceicalia]
MMNQRRTAPLCLPVLCGVLALHAGAAAAGDAAQDLTALPLEQLMSLEVYSASKFVQRASEAPSSVTVITTADIRAYGWRSLAEVLRSVRGVYASYDRNYSYVGARGFLRPGDYNTRFLLQIDGNRINDAVFDSGPMGGEFPLDLELVERIEYVPGPGSSVYGANAFFGVINVITRRPRDIDGSALTLAGGQDGARRGHASQAWTDSFGTDWLLSASRHKTDGRDQFYAAYARDGVSDGVARGLDYESGHRLFAKAIHGAWTATLIHAERDKGVPTASYSQRFNDPRSRTVDTQNYADLAYRTMLSPQIELNARAYWAEYGSLGYYVGDDANGVLNRDVFASRWCGAELTLLANVGDHKLLAGLSYEDDYRQRMLNFDVDPYALYLNENHDGNRYGLYLQDQLALTPALLLNAGLRYDRQVATGGVFSPRLALVHQWSAATTLKAMYGNAYRAPNNYELYYSAPGDGGQLANPALGRERIVSAELALVRQLAGNRRVTVSAFRNVVSALITQVDQGRLPIFVNAGRAVARGVEFEYEQNWSNAARLKASYSWQRTRQDGGDGEGGNVNTPSQLVKLNLTMPLHGAWRAGAEAQYVGRRAMIQGGSTGAALLANLNLYSHRLTRHADLALTAYNLFNRRYADPASVEHLQDAILQDGRRLQLKLMLDY